MAISFIQANSANSSSATLSSTTARDLIIVFAYNNASTTVPTVPTGYTTITSNTTTATAGVAAYKLSSGGETSTGTWTNATNIVVIVYRNAFAVGTSGSGVGNSATITYPTITLKNTSGTSWVAASAIEKSATAGMNGTTTALVSNRTNQTTVNGLDTNGGVTSFAAQTLTVTTSGRFVAFSVELLAMPDIKETLTMSESAVSQILGGSVALQDFNTQTNDTDASRTAGSEALTIQDALVKVLGLNEILSDQLVLSEAFTYNLQSSGPLEIDEVLSDQMVMADGLNPMWLQLSDQMVMSDGTAGSNAKVTGKQKLLTPKYKGQEIMFMADHLDSVGTPVQVNYSDQLLMADNVSIVLTVAQFGITDSLQMFDSIQLADTNKAAYLELFDEMGWNWADAQAQSLQPSITFSDAFTETLNLVEGLSLQLGLLLSDQLVMSDSVAFPAPPLTETLSDTLTMTDVLGIGYGVGILTETLSLSDAAGLGYGLLTPDQIVFADVLAIGYGNALADQLVLSDAEVTVLGLTEQLGDSLTLTDALSALMAIAGTFTDQMVLSDSSLLGYGLLPADQLVFSESLIIGYGQANVDSLTFADATNLGYGDIIGDALVLSDASVVVLGINEPVSDQLVLSDSVGIGYGNSISDQLVFSESLTLGYGQGTVDALTMSDASRIGYGDIISDQMALSDAFSFFMTAPNLQISFSDQLVLSDALGIGYGEGTVDALTLADASGIGFGDIITDAMTLTDAEVNVLGFAKTLSDTMTLTDALGSLLSAAFGLSDTLVLSDALVVGYGNQIVEQLTLVDGPAIGYGDIIAESMNFWADAFQFSTGQPAISLALSDAMVMAEQIGAGYGNAVADQITMTEAVSYLEAMLLQITDASPVQLDALGAIFSFGLQVNESFVLQDQLSLLYGLIVGTESMSMADNLNPQLIGPLALALAEPEVSHFLDAILTSMVFAPGQVVIGSLLILQRVVAELSQPSVRVGAGSVSNQSEVTANGPDVLNQVGAGAVSVETEG